MDDGNIISYTAVTDSDVVIFDRSELDSPWGEEFRRACHETIVWAYLILLKRQVIWSGSPRRKLLSMIVSIGNAFLDEEVMVSQEDLASMAHVSRVTANRALAKMKDEGLVELGYKTVRIPDRQRLLEALERTS